MNSHLVVAVIYADDITLLGTTPNSVMALLDVCSNYAHVFIFHVIKIVFQEKNYHLLALL